MIIYKFKKMSCNKLILKMPILMLVDIAKEIFGVVGVMLRKRDKYAVPLLSS